MATKTSPPRQSSSGHSENPKLVTAEDRTLAAERLSKMSAKGYGDASKFFSSDQREAIMKAATRNLLKK